MRFAVLQERLAAALKMVASIEGRRKDAPIYHQVLLVASGSTLLLRAANAKCVFQVRVGAKVDQEGSVLALLRPAFEIVSALDAERVDVVFTDKRLTLTCGDVSAVIPAKQDDFIPMPTPNGSPVFRMDGRRFWEYLRQVMYAAATEWPRPILTGVHIVHSGHSLQLECSDGIRISRVTIPLEGQPMDVTLPVKMLRACKHLIAEDRQVEMFVIDDKALFVSGDAQLMITGLEGYFPQADTVFPLVCNTTVTLLREDFLLACKRADIFGRDANYMMTLEFHDGRLTWSAKSSERGNASGMVEAQIEGDPFQVLVNGRFLVDLLSALDDEQVRIEFASPQAPVVLRSDPSSLVGLVMPMAGRA